MNTPSHLLMTAAARLHPACRRAPWSAILLGSVAPDIPLYLLTFGGFAYLRGGLGWSARDAFRHMFDTLFFEHPLWIVTHNLLHAPFVLAAALLIVKWRSGDRFLDAWWTWFLLACSLHSLVDIVTHHDDGPLLLFPFDWRLRFASPVSYWDPAHFGRPFMVAELLLDLALLAWFPIAWRLRRRASTAAEPDREEFV